MVDLLIFVDRLPLILVASLDSSSLGPALHEGNAPFEIIPSFAPKSLLHNKPATPRLNAIVLCQFSIYP